jgi:predicted regulator of Ras-like GTPase activity (Roadblock/LC7/MglB family)
MTNQQFNEGCYTLRSGITIYPSQNRAISQALANLTHKAPARFILLADVTGQIVSTRGEQSDIDLVALGSLMAGDLAASQEIARLTGEYQDYQMILREGTQMHTFISEAGHHLALLVQVSNEVPLGWARVIIRRASQEIEDIVANPPQEAKQSNIEEQLDPILIEDELADLFSDALDDLWSE